MGFNSQHVGISMGRRRKVTIIGFFCNLKNQNVWRNSEDIDGNIVKVSFSPYFITKTHPAPSLSYCSGHETYTRMKGIIKWIFHKRRILIKLVRAKLTRPWKGARGVRGEHMFFRNYWHPFYFIYLYKLMTESTNNEIIRKLEAHLGLCRDNHTSSE